MIKMRLIHIDNIENFDNVLGQVNDNLVIVDFYAKWCGPCQKMKPFFEELSDIHQNVIFMTVDIDNAEEIAQYYNVKSLPTFKFIKNRQEIDTVVGADRDLIIQKLYTYS